MLFGTGARQAVSGDRRGRGPRVAGHDSADPHHHGPQLAVEQRSTPLIYGKHGDDYVVVASKGGAPEHPGLVPEPVRRPGGDRAGPAAIASRRRARTASSDEKPELWQLMTDGWPPYDEYQHKTDREIPVVVLEREA